MSLGGGEGGQKDKGFPHLLLALALILLALFASYQLQRRLTVDVGSLWDIPFVSNFNADEADTGYRYRWTKNHSEVRFPGGGSAKWVVITVWAQGVRLSEQSRPMTMSVLLNDQLLGYEGTGQFSQLWAITLTQQLQPYDFNIGADWYGNTKGITHTDGSTYTLSIDTSTFRPPGDSRTLGAKIDRVELAQDDNGLNWPPLWMVFWSLVAVAGLFGIFSPLPSRFPILPYVGTTLLILLMLLNRLYTPIYLPPLALALGVLGLLVWQREKVGRWPEAVDALRTGSWASLVMVLALVAYAGVTLWVIPQVDNIGHADYAENAVIARNLVSGRGFTVDYMAQFYKDYGPGISHPADTWPLLQPLLIAPFFALLGVTTWAAKLPNLFLLLALTWGVYHVASRLWDSRVGLIAGLLTLVHPYFFNSVLYPINDLAFTLIFFVLAWLVWREIAPLAVNSRFPTWTALAARLHRRSLLAIGALSGLLVWSKPIGAVLILGLGLVALWVWWRRGPGKRSISWKALALTGGAAAVVLLPLVIRNLLAFGTPFYSTEGYDAWVLRYWPQHDWEDIYKFYIGSELPHPRWIVGGKFGYQNLVDAILGGFQNSWQKGILSDPSKGDYIIGLLPLSGALLGLAAATRRVKGLFGMALFTLGLYALFVLLYWHFEGRYFQVAVPWLYMLLAWGIFWIWDRLRFWTLHFVQGQALDFGFPSADLPPEITDAAKIQNPKSKIPLLLLPIAVVGFLWLSIATITMQIQADTTPTGFVTGMKWLKDHSSPQDVVMTRDPWELNWYTERKSVMVPNNDLKTIEQIARRYGVTILQLGGPVDGIDVRECPGVTGSRPALGKLYCGEERSGYKLAYRQGGLTVYRVGGR